MADIIKVPSGFTDSRYIMQTFTNTDATTGDVIRVDLSLGRDARQVVIEPADGDLTVVFNAYERVYKRRSDTSDGVPFTSHIPNLAKAYDVLMYEGKPQVTILDGVIYTESITPTKDIYIVNAVGVTFTITVR
jgi:hypothetical protein